MKNKGYQRYQEKKMMISGKKVIGIDPAKEKHQAAVVNEQGVQIGNSFSFQVSYKGYYEDLWAKIGRILEDFNPEDVVFSVETSCNLWKTITEHVVKKGYTVLLVNPLTTYHSRPLMNHDYSKTDPKDALLVATNAYNGNYNTYKRFASKTNSLHSLCITYDKLQKDRTRNILRLRSFMEEVFPEYLQCLDIPACWQTGQQRHHCIYLRDIFCLNTF